MGSAAGISFAFYIHVSRNFARELRIEDCFSNDDFPRLLNSVKTHLLCTAHQHRRSLAPGVRTSPVGQQRSPNGPVRIEGLTA